MNWIVRCFAIAVALILAFKVVWVVKTKNRPI